MGTVNHHSPRRTCIGCRERVAATDLLRVVAAPDGDGSEVLVVPDPRRRMPGRGAWLHDRQECLDQAIRRRAFGRALRVSGPVDPDPVRRHVAQ